MLKNFLFLEGFQIYRVKDNRLVGALEGPPKTPYENGFFIFEMIFPDDFPFKPPKFIFKTKIFHPNIPKYLSKIKRCNENDEDLRKLIENLKTEIYLEIKNSIKKLKIVKKVVYGISLVLMNIDKEIDKKKLKNLFDYIPLKFILIKPVSQKEENAFIDYCELDEKETFILKLSCPILKQVFKMILKEYKKSIYDQTIVSC